MTERRFRWAIGALVLLRVAPALVVLIANGRSLPLFPGYGYGPPRGDTFGFYAAAREFISSWTHVPKGLLGAAVIALALVAVLCVRGWQRGRRAEAIVAAAVAVGFFVSLAVHEMGLTGAGAVGWPIVWSIPLFPLRAASALHYHAAFYLGIAILVAANAVTIVATALLGRRLIGPRLALLAPALLVVWPFAMRAIEGTGNGVYGSWLDDVGVLLYSEPLSTALVTCALALVVLRTADPAAAALAGALVGFSTAVRVSNATLVVVLLLAILSARRWRSAAAFAVAAGGMLVIAATFWSRGYSSFPSGPSKAAPNGLFSWHYIVRSWRDSVVFDWTMLAILVPLPLVGLLALRRRTTAVAALGGIVAVTAAFYSLYYITALHPRFLFVALPSLFVLAAAGVGLAAERLRGDAAASGDDRNDRAEDQPDHGTDDERGAPRVRRRLYR